jgi:hypothetical protein
VPYSRYVHNTWRVTKASGSCDLIITPRGMPAMKGLIFTHDHCDLGIFITEHHGQEVRWEVFWGQGLILFHVL